MKTFVIGHRNPDTDAICSAIGYAELLKRTSCPDAIAACCGPPNLRTAYALEKCGLDAPRIIMDVRPEIEDFCDSSPIVAHEQEVFFEVYKRIRDNQITAVPVLAKNGSVRGMITLLDLLQLVFDEDDDPVKSRQVVTSLAKICEAVNGSFQNVVDKDGVKPLLLLVGAMSAEVFVERAAQYPPAQLVIVSGDRPTIQRPAIEMGVQGLVITGGHELPPYLLELARDRNVSVIRCPHGTATATIRLKTARSIDSAVDPDFVTLGARQNVADARNIVERSGQRVFPVLNDEGGLVGVVSRSQLFQPPRHRLVLVDHNELQQAVNGAEEADIVEVLDHHRLGGSIRSANPIRFINEPVGSTCTLVAKAWRGAGLVPPPPIALCLASGIISDTLYLRSPTTTDIDREVIGWLQSVCDIDLDSFAMEFFNVGSALRSSTAERVVREDCKEFEEQGHRFSISQIEEIGFELFWSRKSELHTALGQFASERRLDFAALLITDIVTNGSLLLMSDEPKTWESINYPRLERHLYQLDGVVSRKKQLLPLISRLVAGP